MKTIILTSTLLLIFSYSNAQVNKKVLLEESSYATCGNYPEGAVWMDSITTEFPNVICVSHHIYADAVTIPGSVSWSDDLAPGAPLGCIDRVDFGTTGTVYELTSEWRDKVIQQLATTAVVGVSITGSYNTVTRKLNVTAEANFTSSPSSGDLRINVFVVEDSVTGTGSGYDQVNYYNTVVGHPYYGAGDPIVGYVHQHVIRAFLSDIWGTAGVIPSNPSIYTPYSQNYSYTIPSNFNENQISIVAFVSYYNASISQREVLNVNIINLDELSPTFTNDLSQDKNSVFIYPQPFSDFTTLTFSNSKNESHTLLLYDVQGRLVRTVTNITTDKVEIAGKNLTSGIYFFMLRTQDLIQATGKLIVE